MSTFPLYESLSKGISNKDLPVKSKNDFIRKIQDMDVNGCELIYALIKVYHDKHEKHNDSSSVIPYDGEYDSMNMKFDMNAFPNELRQLLYKFVKIHEKTVIEDNERQELRSSPE